MSSSKGKPSPVWLEFFPELAAITDPAWQRALDTARQVELPAGHSLYQDGQSCETFILILSGTVKVEKISPSGQEITLYHLHPGQICELTTSCLMSSKCYHANAVTETTVQAAMIPKAAFQTALVESTAFRHYIYNTVEQAMADLVTLLETVITEPMGQRLAHHLMEQAHDTNPIICTHYQIATELGTAREVISRLLKDFERSGCIKLHRGNIEILDIPRLQHLSEEN